MERKLPVVEIFGPTIQGEGSHTGRLVQFVRFAGCDNKCKWCDTKKAWDIHNVIMLPNEEIVDRLFKNKEKTDIVVITGGNPCLHDLSGLLSQLERKGFECHLETQGTIAPEWLSQIDVLTLSPKTPSSGNYTKIISLIDCVKQTKGVINLKLVIDSDNEEDWKYLDDCIKVTKIYSGAIRVFIQPVDDISQEYNEAAYVESYRKLVLKLIEKGIQDVSVLPQMHKIVWGRKEGV